jgi:molybdopterin-guanine dinucleotide biosynthesis protein A
VRRGAIVLAGGRSTRMGRDKATLPFGDETLLQRVVRLVTPLVEEVAVVGRPDQALPPLGPDVVVARDRRLDQGPLGGLHPGLETTSADAAYVTGCDVPFLVPAVVEHLFDRLAEVDVVVCEAEGHLHPLAAVYRASVAPHVERLLEEGRLRPIFLYDLVRTVRVPEEDLRRLDPELDTLANLNTPAAYEAALARLETESAS